MLKLRPTPDKKVVGRKNLDEFLWNLEILAEEKVLLPAALSCFVAEIGVVAGHGALQQSCFPKVLKPWEGTGLTKSSGTLLFNILSGSITKLRRDARDSFERGMSPSLSNIIYE